MKRTNIFNFKSKLASMKKQFLLILMSVLSIMGIHAQNITGKMLGSEDNLPLPGVSIVVKGTANGTVTDVDGQFSLKVSPKDVLVFSFVGFENQEVTVGDNKTFTINLQASANLLQETVVVGYGNAYKKKESTGANSQMRGDVIENIPMQSFDRAMQGPPKRVISPFYVMDTPRYFT
jgi:TonB-dependent starch-binding outer membrane protein SusC